MHMKKEEQQRDVIVSIGIPWFTLWFILWIFTIAFAHLSYGQAWAAIIIWPYYLGDALAVLVR